MAVARRALGVRLVGVAPMVAALLGFLDLDAAEGLQQGADAGRLLLEHQLDRFHGRELVGLGQLLVDAAGDGVAAPGVDDARVAALALMVEADVDGGRHQPPIAPAEGVDVVAVAVVGLLGPHHLARLEV